MKDDELLRRTHALVKNERAVTAEILNAINEIELRRLHLLRGFSSLHEFLVKSLGYSDGASHRRISAARLLKAVPEVISSINDGSVNLTTAAPRPEAVRQVMAQGSSSTQEFNLEVRIQITPELQKKLTRLREIFSHHKDALGGYGDLMELMADELLKKADPLEKKTPRVNPTESYETKPNLTSPKKSQPAESPQGQNIQADACVAEPLRTTTAGNSSRYIPVKIKNEIYQRDEAQCSYVDPQSKRQCGSKRFLNIDHITPLAVGGKTSLGNCRLLCAAHNQLAAIQALGRDVMGTYLKL